MKAVYSTAMKIRKVNEKFYCSSAAIPNIERYIKKFEELTIITRVLSSKEVPNNFKEISGNIKIIGRSSYKGFFLKSMRNEIKETVKKSEIILAHLPAIPTYLTVFYSKKLRKKYCSIIVGCTWDGFFNYNMFGKIVAPLSYYIMRKCVKSSSYAIYVTTEFLQKRYPTNSKSINASNVVIEKADIEILKKRLKKLKNLTLTLGTCAAVNVKFKGQDDVIKAISGLVDEGLDVTYRLAGGGDQSYLKGVAKKFGVEDRIIFEGRLNKIEVEKLLDSIDIYIQPSKQEGLPRAVIEAMNRACPCLGSDVAGIPELLNEKFIFKRGNVKQIQDKIKLVMKYDWNKMSKRNFEESKKYLNFELEEKRNKYFDKMIKELKNELN